MDFNKLNYLLAVAELKSFSKAAQKCFVSQPALTRCVKNIEDELGVNYLTAPVPPFVSPMPVSATSPVCRKF